METERIPHTCPLCVGKGELLKSQQKKNAVSDTCHGCCGSGIVMGQRTRFTPDKHRPKSPLSGSRYTKGNHHASRH